MKYAYARLLIALGLLLVAGGVFLSVHDPAHAQGLESAGYVGAANCAGCHQSYADIHNQSRHALTLRDVTADKASIIGDFTTGEGERTVQFPGESAPRPFTAADIAYVVGAGTYTERYLYRMPDGSLMVFPAQVSTPRKSWQRYERGTAWPSPAYDWNLNCAGCHTTGLTQAGGAWQDSGVQCEACHGPGSLHADVAKQAGKQPNAEQLAAIRSSTVLTADGQVCGRCHSAGHDPLTNLPYPVNFVPGKPLIDPSTFTLIDPLDTKHWSTGGRAIQPNMQYNEWAASQHGNNLQALKDAPNADATCLRCHTADVRVVMRLNEAFSAGQRAGEAPALTVPTAQTGVTCVACHDPHLTPKKPQDAQQNFHLIAPANDLCISCHNDQGWTGTPHSPVQEIYEGLPVVEEVKGIASRHSTLKAAPRCMTCHAPKIVVEGVKAATHNLKAVTTAPIDTALVRTTCSGCHTNYPPKQMQGYVESTQGKIKSRWDAVKAALRPDSPAWLRKVVDTIEADGSWGIHNPRYVIALLRAAEGALGIQ